MEAWAVACLNVCNFSISQNETVKIMTGAPVPRGANSVVMIEDTEENDGTVKGLENSRLP